MLNIHLSCLSNPTPTFLCKGNKTICLHIDLYMNVCSSFVGNSQKLYKQSKYSSTRQCSGILLTTKKEYELLIQDTSMNLKKISLSKKKPDTESTQCIIPFI